MTYRGRVKDGKIVIEEGPPLDEGALIQFELVGDRTANAARFKSLLDLLGIAGELPDDAARNYKHYLYGHPKK
jgi:hypothetical protein